MWAHYESHYLKATKNGNKYNIINYLTKILFWISSNHQSNCSMQDLLKCKEEEMNLKMLLVLSIFSGPLHAQEFWEKVDTSFHASVSTLITNDSGHIFSGTNIGVFISKNNGDNWTEVNNGLTRLGVRSLAINDSGHIFAGTNNNGISRTFDNSKSRRSKNEINN